MTINTFGNAPVTGANRFTLEPGRADGTAGTLPLATTVTQDSFAIAQFVQLSDDERLARPSFEPKDAGIRFGTDDVVFHYDPLVDSNLEYETQIVVPGQEEPPQLDVCDEGGRPRRRRHYRSGRPSADSAQRQCSLHGSRTVGAVYDRPRSRNSTYSAVIDRRYSGSNLRRYARHFGN